MFTDRRPTPLFSDIQNHWARDCIAELAAEKMIFGDVKGKFRPNDRLTRAEFAALMYWLFPQSPRVQDAPAFVDVSRFHWAARTVKWVVERGLFSGYGNGRFRPDAWVTRSQAFLVLARGLNYVQPLLFQYVLQDYFDDAADIPAYARGAIAAATLGSLVVNYPDVRQLRPNQPITRGEVAAILCQLKGKSHTLPRRYVTWSVALAELPADLSVPWADLRSNGRLTRQIQTRMGELGLYALEANGHYTPETETALLEFSRVMALPNQHSRQFNGSLAQTILATNPTCFALAQARDRTVIYNEFLAQEKGFNSARLAFLDKGIKGSPFEKDVPQFPAYLAQTLPTPTVVDIADAGSSPKPFPSVGQLPDIDDQALSFLHSDIVQACVCIGTISQGQVTARWLGKNALTNVELWSATKIIPLVQVVCRMNARHGTADVDNQVIRSRGGGRGFSLHDLVVDMVNYKNAIASSNSLAAMFKQFDSPQNLENWLKSITGNRNLIFRGRYGEGPFITAPELWDRTLQRVVLPAGGAGHRGNNTISTYDLTRLITMLGWHPHLPADAQLPGGTWASLESVIRALGADSARYADVALERLKLTDAIASPVVFSKMGFGRSGIRHRTELVYTAFIQFADPRPCTPNGSNQPVLRSLGVTMIGAKKLGNGDREATQLDARLAADLTEILRRLVTQEL